MEAERAIDHLVVVGASAGGVEALIALLQSLKPDLAAPIVVAQHLDPHRTSFLPEILARHSTLPVRSVAEREPLEPGVVYVTPANHHVEIIDHEIRLRPPLDSRPVPSIDLLFQSAAERYGEGVIAVILTGTGSDGTVGARAVKESGGTVVIQNPASARYSMMPRSLAPNTVDIVAHLEQIGGIIGDLVSGLGVPLERHDDRDLREFLDQLRNRSGVDFGSYKEPTILRRLHRRIIATGCSDLASYAAYMAQHPEEYERLVSSFLINVTEFFRDPELFDFLGHQLLPELLNRADLRGQDLRIWSAGCATGEEAYSLAILVAELLGDELEHSTIRIFATDLDEDAIQFARRGIYPAAALGAMSPDRVARFFTRTDGSFEVSKPIRSLVIFGQHDLGQRAPFPQTDLVLCRNVLIYFTSELQRRALQLFAFSLRDGGYLALGKSESAGPASEFFATHNSQLKVYRLVGERVMIPPGRYGEALPGPLRDPFVDRTGRVAELTRLQREAGAARVSSARSESALLQLPIGVVVVNSHYDIETINTVARGLLGIYGLAVGEDLIHLVQEPLARRLKAAIDTALRGSRGDVVHDVIEAAINGEHRALDVRCQARVLGSDADAATALLIIADVTALAAERQQLQGEVANQQERIAHLDEQLLDITRTNTDLLRANQELATANTQLRANNEEVLVGTEELQAASEEVETLNEELQATNEELETLNEELQATVEELKTTTDDLESRRSELSELADEREEQRLASEGEREKLVTVLNFLGDAIAAFDGDGTPVATNAAYDGLFSAALQLEAEDGTPLPADQDPRARVLGDLPFTMRFGVRGGDGCSQHYEATGQRAGDGSGPVAGVLTVRKITP